MPATIKIKNSSTTGAVPTSSDLVQGELAVNVADLGLYTENASGTVVKLNAPSIDDKNTGATKRLTIDTSGNLGLGVTPSAWSSASAPAFQLKNGAALFSRSGATAMSQNFYYDATDTAKYIANGYAALYFQTSGQHQWFNAASGTAGNTASFTQAMTLDASGNLGIGTTSPGGYRLNVNGTSTFSDSVNLSSGKNLLWNGGDVAIANSGTNLLFYTYSGSLAERARIDSSGRLLVGTTNTDPSGSNVSGFAVASSGFISLTGNATAAIDCNRTNDGTIQGFRRGGTLVGSVSVTTTATAYNTSSDYRLKDITGGLTGYKERLLALEPKQGSWKVDGSEFRGFLAHEFANSYPSSVNGEKDAVDTNGNPQYQGMQAGSPEVIADLVAYIKELENRLSALEQA
jgi:hypothetical protein